MTIKSYLRRAGGSSGYLCFAGCLRAVLLLLLLPGLALCKEEMSMVSGKVVDATTKKGLPFANILVQETRYRTSANINGDFRIPLPPNGSQLQVSYVGYKTDSLEADPGHSPVTVRLTPVGYVADEVDVVGKKIAEGMQNSYRLGNAEIKDFSGITHDPMRALQMMPGVSTNDVASAKMNVRGGTWDENTVLIDGAEIEDPYHLKEISLASISIFNEDMVKDMYFSSGGFGVKYGDALSSVTSIHYKEGNRKLLEGNLNLSPLDFNACIQGPINSRSSFIVAARGSYLGYMLKGLRVSQDIYGGYYDVQGDVAYHTSGTGKLQLDFLYSKDDAIQSPSLMNFVSERSTVVKGSGTLAAIGTQDMQSFDGHYSNSFLSATYTDIINDRWEIHTLAYFTGNLGHENPVGNTSISIKYGSLPDYFTNERQFITAGYHLWSTTYSLNQAITLNPSPSVKINAGMGVKRLQYNYLPDVQFENTSESNIPSFPDTTVRAYSKGLSNIDTTAVKAETYALSGYVQQRSKFGEELTITTGVRFDYLNLDKESRFSPRVSILYFTPLGVELTGAWGIYYQRPAYYQIRSSVPSDTNTHFQEATQYVLGLEKEIMPDIGLHVQVYWKYYHDNIPAIRLFYGRLFYGEKENDGTGYAKGFDIQYSMKLDRLGLFVGYSYSVSKEKSGTDPNYYPRISDQRHTASVELTYAPSYEWSMEIRGYYGSGYAYTPSHTVLDSLTMTGIWIQGSANSAHYPPYERVDFRITKAFTLFHNPLQLFLDVTNVLDRRNVWAYHYTYDSQGNPVVDPLTLLGIIPAIGVSYRFGG